MKKLLPIIFLLTFSVQAQKLNDLVQQLKDKTQSSIHIYGNSVFYSTFTFDKNGFTETLGSDNEGNTFTHLKNGQNTIIVRWEDLEDIGLTKYGRVAVSEDADSKEGYFFTPAYGATAEEVKEIIRDIYRKITGDSLTEINVVNEPLDDTDRIIENSLATEFFEISGRSSGLITGTPGDDEHPFDVTDLRAILSFGKHFRFDMGILGYSWIDLPEYTKYNASGAAIGTDSFIYSTGFWTPSLGLSYVFYPKPSLGDYVIVEFPLSISFAPMLFGSNGDFDDDATSGDSLSEDYFAFSYIGQASLGATIYFSETFGISLKGGVYYIGLNASTDTLTGTNQSGVTEEYTIKFDEEESNIKPYLEFSLKFRWN
jgi:hypothetical protein